jgi:hypothetical protein
MKVTYQILNTKQFTYEKESKRFVAEDSSLKVKLDPKLNLVSERTGKASQFFFAGTISDQNDETIAWVYHPSAESVVKYPGLAGASIHILND